MDYLDKIFELVKRKYFAPYDILDAIDLDIALPIGYGQTISQPSTVKMMFECLDVQKNDNVLDVGSGSGWTTALIATIVGKNGKVTAVELIPELVDFGKNNCKNFGINNAKFHQSSKTIGWPKGAPYDRILVSASANSYPKELTKQLKIGGKIVIPVKNNILEITKINDLKLDIVSHPGFTFVPLIN